MFFAAKEAVERRARARDERMREEGRAQGIEQGRLQVLNLLEKHGIELPPDAEEYFNGSQSKIGK